jgi:hypothetical protein
MFIVHYEGTPTQNPNIFDLGFLYGLRFQNSPSDSESKGLVCFKYFKFSGNTMSVPRKFKRRDILEMENPVHGVSESFCRRNLGSVVI